MTDLLSPEILAFDAEALAARPGRITILVDGDAPAHAGARRID